MENPFDFPNPFTMSGRNPAPNGAIAAPMNSPQNPDDMPGQLPAPPMTPEEHQNLLERIGSGLGSGLSFVAGALNKPGRAIRGLLGGTPREALNLIPFSDALGITDPTQEVRGSHLLYNMGITDNKDPSLFSPEGAAGLGVDIATDPLTWIPGGALLRGAGAATRGTGRAARAAAQLIPGGSRAVGAFDAVSSGLGDLYTHTIPPLFQAAVKGRTTAVGQDVARAITAGAPEAIARANMEVMPLAQKAVAGGFNTPESAMALRTMGETGLGLTQGASDILDPVHAMLARSLASEQSMGLPSHALEQTPFRSGPAEGLNQNYLPRESTPSKELTARGWVQSSSVKPEKEFARKDWTDGLTTEHLSEIASKTPPVTSGTANPAQQVEQWIGDTYLNVPKAKAAADAAQDAVHTDMAAHQGILSDASLSDDLIKAQAVHAALTDQAKTLAQMKIAGSLPEFANHPLKDVATKMARSNYNLLTANEIYKGAAGAATQAASESTVPIMDFLNTMWKTGDAKGVVNAAAPSGAQLMMAKHLGVSVQELSGYHITKEIAKDLAGLTTMHSVPGLEMFTKVFDSVTNLTKAGQTMFPATVSRNVVTDLYNKIVYGMSDPAMSRWNPLAYLKPIQEWKSIANGGTVDGLAERVAGNPAFKGMSDAEVSGEMRKLYTAWDVGHEGVKRRAMQAGEVTEGAAGIAEKSLGSLLPISDQKGVLSSYFSAPWRDPSAWKAPLSGKGVAGVFGESVDKFPPVAAARFAKNANDSITRGSSFYAGLLQGKSAEEAFHGVLKAHYDYANLSGFERSFMRRVMPFYGWARQNIPAVITEIIHRPGGVLAQSIRGAEEAKGPHPGFLPPQITGGVAAPLGAEANGQQRYLSHLGLSFEDLGSLNGPGGPLGMLNPMIKAPIEGITGKQMFTGRDLRDLHSPLENVGAPPSVADNLLANSPLGRTASTINTLLDPRKDVGSKLLNTLSGARVSDVDVAAARRRAVQDYISQALHGPGVSHFDTLAVKPGNIQNLSPFEQHLWQMYRSQQGNKPAPLATLR